ncbi:hypothetical protein MXB_4875, partial [Myxobolus squamalis]
NYLIGSKLLRHIKKYIWSIDFYLNTPREGSQMKVYLKSYNKLLAEYKIFPRFVYSKTRGYISSFIDKSLLDINTFLLKTFHLVFRFKN